MSLRQTRSQTRANKLQITKAGSLRWIQNKDILSPMIEDSSDDNGSASSTSSDDGDDEDSNREEKKPIRKLPKRKGTRSVNYKEYDSTNDDEYIENPKSRIKKKHVRSGILKPLKLDTKQAFFLTTQHLNQNDRGLKFPNSHRNASQELSSPSLFNIHNMMITGSQQRLHCQLSLNSKPIVNDTNTPMVPSLSHSQLFLPIGYVESDSDSDLKLDADTDDNDERVPQIITTPPKTKCNSKTLDNRLLLSLR